MDDKLIQNIMHIIVNSGEAKSSSVEAIRFAKENRFKDAYRKLKDADDLLNEAHKGQTYFLSQEADGKKITTIEGVKEEYLKQAFIDVGAVQCGFCTPGMLMSAKALLMKNPSPTEEEIKTAIAGNLCRCTGYNKIVQAIKEAAE